MNIEIKKLSLDNGEDIYQMLQSIPANENGFVNGIVLELTEKDKSKVIGFNSTYEFYNGTESGFSVKNLLEKVITNNKETA
mgnify:CR=1 FL=1